MRLLLVEDDRVVRVTVRDALEAAGYQVTECADGRAAVHAIESHSFDLVLTDIRLPGLSGIDLFRRLRVQQAGAAVVLMTAYGSTDEAVAVMREGARDYITKPFEMDELILRLGRIVGGVETRRTLEEGAGVPVVPSIRGDSPATVELLERLNAAAASDVNVLITGETGTGKDLCARTIHTRSARAPRPFVALNCSALPESLIEAELFGHEKGAFTGADRKRVGRFEAADRGTIFLDEIGDLPLAQQAKLLRVIDTQTFEPLGSNRPVHVNVRIISATNSNLEQSVERKAFRSDLYYRLNVIDIRTPPLRDRRADIPELVADLLADISLRHHRPQLALDPRALALLMLHDYPGNVRELLHALEHAVALSRGETIEPRHLPRSINTGAAPGPAEANDSLGHVVERFERQYIRHVLDRVEGHRGKAAALLGISRKSLWQKLKGDAEPEPEHDG